MPDQDQPIAGIAAEARQLFLENLGIADGWTRSPPDPAYAQEEAYRRGHAKGLTLPPREGL